MDLLEDQVAKPVGDKSRKDVEEPENENILFENTDIDERSPHVLNRSAVEEFKCEECDYKVKSKSHLSTHIKNHRISIQCDMCETKFGRKDMLMKHMRTCHVEESKIEKTRSKQFNCNDCSFQGENSLELK